MKHYLSLFLIALLIRFLWWWVFPPPYNLDADYFGSLTSSSFHSLFWSWNPGYVAFVWLIHSMTLLLVFQGILSALTCCWVNALYPGAGWLLAVYIPLVAYSCVAVKFALVGFLFTGIWWLVKKRDWRWGFLVVPMVLLFFSRIGYNVGLEHEPFLRRILNFWSPFLMIPDSIPKPNSVYAYPWGLVWMAALACFLRTWPLKSVEMVLFGGLSAMALVFGGRTLMRLSFEPVILGMLFESVRRIVAEGSPKLIRRVMDVCKSNESLSPTPSG